jgi:pimeloyl-ACP methyl ester carboxylesterase
VAFDFLGYGGSDKPTDYPYTAANLEGDLEPVVDALALDSIIPVAHDASGPTAINWALAHADQVAALALLNTYYSASPSLRVPEFVSLFADPAYAKLAAVFADEPAQFGWLLDFQGRQFRRDAPPPLSQRAYEALDPVIQGQFAAQPSVLPAFVQLTRELHASIDANTQRAPQLAGFPAPVGLVWGAGDPYMNRGVAEHLQSLFAAAEVRLLAAGHWPQIDAPDQVAKALLALATTR